MSGRRSFNDLRAQIDVDPIRRHRVDEIKRAIREIHALAELRESRHLTQKTLADLLGVTQANISRIEHQDDLFLSTLKRYIEAMDGHLLIRAVFADGVVDFLDADAYAVSEIPQRLRRRRRLRPAPTAISRFSRPRSVEFADAGFAW